MNNSTSSRRYCLHLVRPCSVLRPASRAVFFRDAMIHFKRPRPRSLATQRWYVAKFVCTRHVRRVNIRTAFLKNEKKKKKTVRFDLSLVAIRVCVRAYIILILIIYFMTVRYVLSVLNRETVTKQIMF